MIIPTMTKVYRKIAIKNLAILQTGVRLRRMPAILCYRTIFSPHRTLPLSPEKGDKGLVAKIVRCLVWQVTCQFSQKSIAVFGL
ncbi:MAG: hypothetical protein A3G39_10005 [Deltaproteobacteria bacterium RIFCSPLOWO2_12_FULL_43_16]|nr:MAG: hypothetical protein A2Z89_03115 [Deltaproteobacteria bacterium GWA2_43_19]OGQ58520.1 MAG: hypothetical protein A3G39_10005 [Deltaproteobacteria bacterium RIFCSPLOWO2_12_FULL_43_16]